MKKFYFLFFVCLLFFVNTATADTKTGSWDLTKLSNDWTASRHETYFKQPYGFKKVNGTLTNKFIADFYTAGITEITVGFKCLQNGGNTSKLTIYLVDKDGNAIGSGVEVTPVDASDANNTTYQYATFTENLEGATGFMMKVTTYGKKILVNGAEYTVTYTSTNPSITTTSSKLSFGDVETSSSKELSFTLSGQNLTENAALSITGTDAGYFSVAPASVSQTDGTIAEKVTVTYAPTAVDAHTATLQIKSGETIKEIALSGTGIAPLPTYTVSWEVNGVPYTTGGPSTSVKSGERVTALPTEPAAIGTKKFVGWTNAQIAAAQPTAPAVLFTTPENAPAVTDHVTYYAVFATGSVTSDAKSLSEITDGGVYHIVATQSGTNYYLKANQKEGAGKRGSTTKVAEAGEFILEGSGDTWAIKVKGTEYYMALNSTNASVTYQTKAANYTVTDETNAMKFVIGKRQLCLNGGTTSNFGSYADTYDGAVYIWLKGIGSYTDYVTTISSSPVTVTFNAGANGTCATASLTETAAGAGVTLPVCVAKEGYKFVGWSTSETPTSADAGQAGETYHPSVDCTLYAYYKQLYTVTIEEPANGTIEVKHGENVVASGEQFVAGDVLTITATPAEGYKFRYVQVEDGTPHTYTASNVKEWTMGEANITISAKFDEITYSTITKEVNGVSTPELVENGTEIPFTAPDAASIPTGYAFVGWTDKQVDGTQADAPTLVSSPVTASTNATYYAVFAVSKSTGDVIWEEITTEPEPGTYAILSDSYFMKAEITTSDRFANGDATPVISETSPATLTTAPASDCIWEITKPDGYYRIANGSKYAGGTSEKNKGALLDDASKDLAKWTIEYNNNQFSVINYGRSEASKDNGNKYLRNNDSYGWACYSFDQGKAPRLFKKTTATVLTDYCTTIPDVELAVGATGYATLYYSNFDLVVPENAEAYTFGSVDGTLMESERYNEGEVIPAGEAVVVYTANDVPCTLNFKKGIATLARDASSQLAGTDEATAITPDPDYYFYGLSLNSKNEPNSVGFYWMVDGGAAFTNGAHKAYLKILKSEFTSTQPVRGFAFKGTATGVESVESSNNAPQAIYDLTGRRVSKAEKGIYIINGKKVIK